MTLEAKRHRMEPKGSEKQKKGKEEQRFFRVQKMHYLCTQNASEGKEA